MHNDNRFLGLIENGIRNNWDQPALTDYNGETFLFKDFAKKIAELHLLFETINLQKGDKIAICGRNSAHWVISFFAGMSYGAVVVTILHDFNPESIHNIVNHSDAKLFFVAQHIWDDIDPEAMPALDNIFLIDDFSALKTKPTQATITAQQRAELFAQRYPNGFGVADLNFHTEQPHELALINYTSGTTSLPKGVMLPYRSLWSNTKFAIESIEFVKPGDGVVCMLPMAHMYGLAFEILLSISKGCHIHFLTRVPSPQIIMEAFAKVNPTLVLAVPVIIEKIVIGKIFKEISKQPIQTLLKIPLINKLVYRKIRTKLLAVFGNNLNEIVIGGAALNTEVGTFLSRIKFPYTVGYGMTECGPLVSYEYWSTYRPTSCGRAVARMEIKIDSRQPERIAGEILVRGDNTMLGYYKNQEATDAIFTTDGWLKTGDLGVMDNGGFLYIKGRSKTMILSASGQNIYPEELEQIINNLPLVAESLVVSRDNKLVALIYPDKDVQKAQNISINQLLEELYQQINHCNKRFPKYAQIATIELRDHEFEKTPKRSIKRFMYE